ncbi:TTN [Mytilus edulis]|uniref:TTN n=1 Tax=Mytilus edulis TaxID=6550 RepID=A0A8S3SDD0_MYTED|nr:TTN [Mytilus edulis]
MDFSDLVVYDESECYDIFQKSLNMGNSFYCSSCPSFEDVPGDQKIRVGSTFEIEVKVKGYPRPEYVTWYKGEDIILKSRRINMQYLNGVAKLKVYDSCADDSGLYECVTENEHGNTTCRISVKIESRQENVAVCPVCMDKQPNKHLPCGHAICAECMERAGLLCGLFTNKWIKTNEYHFGLRRYCNNTIDGTICHNVVDILPNLEYMFDVVYYLSIASCSWIGLVFIVMFSTLRCNGCKGKKTRRCTSLVMFSWCLIQGAVLTIFVTAIIDKMSASLSDAGWSLYLEGATLILSYVLLTIQVCCKDKSGRDSATVDVIDETLSYSIENVLREENVIEGGHAPTNHIMNDPNAIYQ